MAGPAIFTPAVFAYAVLAVSVVVLILRSSLEFPRQLLSAILLSLSISFSIGYFFRPSSTESNKTNDDSKIYGLEHGRLNLQLPPKTMWMNVGYWENDTTSFPEACEALLLRVLNKAGLLERFDGNNMFRRNGPKLRILDVGIGCGDQTAFLLDLASGSRQTNESALSEYTGITIDRKQYNYAKWRLDQQGALSPDTPHSPEKGPFRPSVQLFCADAAKPSVWPAEIHNTFSDDQTDADKSFAEQSWLLALDTFYHFSPSRLPLLTHAHNSLSASFMAFDYLLDTQATLFNRFILRLIVLLLGAPYGNFVTEKEYIALLVQAGYPEQGIEIEDLSEKTFGGLADFLERREGDLGLVGLGLGRFKAAGWVFRWFARSGIVRGCVVVARKT